jgi:hypothetical protein
MGKKGDSDCYRVSAKFCSGQKWVPILGNCLEPQLYVICGSCTSQSHLLLKQVQIIFQVQEHGVYSIIFHLKVLSAVQVMYQASGTADWIYQTEQLQKL